MPQMVRKSKQVRVADIIVAMEHIAPPELAEEWDNCGLQVGSRHWPVHSVWVALDPQPEVIEAAARQKVDMVITHHPLLFQPVRRIDADTPVGSVLQTTLASRIAVYSAHTSLDSALEGVNDLLAQRIGLTEPIAMVPAAGTENRDQRIGIGRMGRLPEPTSLEQLALQLKNRLDLAVVKVSGDLEANIRYVALCSGSGSGLLDEFLASDAQVYISGDLRYHDARIALDQGRALIDVGHFASEQIMIDALAVRLRHELQAAGTPVDVSACRMERDPFRYL